MKVFLLSLLLSAPAHGELAHSVKNFLRRANRAPTATAVAAVRGGISAKQTVDADKKLASKASLLRRSLLSETPAKAAEENLRKIYRALAASYIVKSADIDKSDDVQERASSALKGLGVTPADASWDEYIVSLVSEIAVKSSARAAVKSAKPGVAKLDEELESVLKACKDKQLEKEDLSQGLFLAGLLYKGLSEADFGADAASSEAQAQEESPLPPDDEADAETASKPEIPFAPSSIYKKASPAVVLILCAGKDGTGELGTGSIIDSSGRILTNAHVVIQDSTKKPWESIRVYLKPRKMTGDPDQDLKNPLNAKVSAFSRALDLALLELEGTPPPMPSLSLGRPGDVSIGDQVAAIGHPEEGGLWTLTTGIVSSQIADLGGVKGKKAFQTDTSINRGNSGGPLLSASGDIIGINTSMSRTASDGMTITAVNFAVRADIAKRWLAKSGLKLAYAAEPAAAPSLAASIAPEAAARSVSKRKAVAELERAGPMLKEDMGRSDASLAPGAPPAFDLDSAGAPPPVMREMGEKPSREEHAVITEGKPYSINRILGSKLRELDSSR